MSIDYCAIALPIADDDLWPEAGDRLLLPGPGALLAEDAGERAYRLQRGYKQAADILVEVALADPSRRNNLVYPILFNYRHYVELALKGLIEEHCGSAGVQPGSKDHRLATL